MRADRLAVANAQLDILETAFNDQKMYVYGSSVLCDWWVQYVCVCSPPVPVGVDAQGRTIPGEVPKLFGGELVKYILVSTFML